VCGKGKVVPFLTKYCAIKRYQKMAAYFQAFFTSAVVYRLGYGQDDRDSRVRFPAGTGYFSLHHRVQNCSGSHPASYPIGTRSSFRGGKAAGE
jgi:hypothetical protein